MLALLLVPTPSVVEVPVTILQRMSDGRFTTAAACETPNSWLASSDGTALSEFWQTYRGSCWLDSSWQAVAVPLGDAPAARGRKGAVQGPSPLSQEGNLQEAKWSQSSPNLSSFTSIEEVAMRREIVCDNCERQCPSPVPKQVSRVRPRSDYCAPAPLAPSGWHRPIAATSGRPGAHSAAQPGPGRRSLLMRPHEP